MNRLELARLRAASMLLELQEVHGCVRASLQEMEILTAGKQVDRLEYTAARFRISKASLTRRTSFNAVCTELSKDASAEEAHTIERVRSADRLLSKKSAAHVMRWSADSVDADWMGYCAASRDIRRDMAMELDLEATLIFPLLQKRSMGRPQPLSRMRAA